MEFHPAGYRLAVDPRGRGRAPVRAARRGRPAGAGGRRPRRAAALLREALGLWRGPAAGRRRRRAVRRGQAARLEELAARPPSRTASEAELALGRHRDLVAELAELVAAHPLRERLRGQLMRALYGSGRQAEALEAFEDAAGGCWPRSWAPTRRPSWPRCTWPSCGPIPRSARRPAASRRGRGCPPSSPASSGRDEELGRVARAARGEPPGHADRPRRRGQDPAGDRGGRRGEPGEVCFVDWPRSPTARACRRRCSARSGSARRGCCHAAGARPSTRSDRLVAALADRELLLVLDNCEHVVADAAGLVDRLLGRLPRPARPGDQPGGARHHRRGAAARSRRSRCRRPARRRRRARLPGGAAVRRPGRRRAARLRPSDAGQRRASYADLPALDGLPLAIELAAARLRSLHGRRVAARLRRPVPAAVARRAVRRAAAPDAARGRRVELGPAGRRRAGAGPAADGVRRRRHPGGGRAGVRAAGRRRAARRPGGQVAGRGHGRPLPHARDDPGVLRRAAGRGGRGGGRPRGRTRRTSSTWPRPPTRTCAAPSSWSGWPGSTRRATTSSRPPGPPPSRATWSRPCG